MATFLEGLTSGLRAGYCAIGGLPPEWLVDVYRQLTPPAIVDLGSAINRSICNYPPDQNLEFPPPPFEGGQCPVTYNLVRQAFDGGVPFGGPVTRLGVLGPVSIVTTVTGLTQNSEILNGNGSFVDGISGPAASNPLITITEISRVDGLPDDCGNVPVPLPPVAPITINIDINYEDGDENEFNLTVPVIFAPVYLAFDGTLRIPVTIGDLNFNGELTIAPEFKFELTLPEFGGGGSPDDPELAPSGEPGLDEPDPPGGPDGTIVGVVVRSESFGPVRASTIFQSNMPDILAPRIANVRFLCRFGSLTAWSSDIPVKGVNEYIPCPSPFGAVDVVVSAETNWTTRSTAIRSRPPANFEP